MTTNKPSEYDDHIVINPAFRLAAGNYFLTCFKDFEEDGCLFRLFSYDTIGSNIDSLVLYNEVGKTEFYLYVVGYIDKLLNINTFNYKVNEGKNKSEYPTILTISKFIFNDKTGKFEIRVRKISSS